jgi:CubicO group peptidase (beta-lactamase class C family)
LIAAREAGISLDAPVAHFLGDFQRPSLRDITVRHLLNHNSGIELHLQSLVSVPTDEWIAHIAAADLCAPPGEKALYTCTAYFLLGRLVESWTAMSLDRWIEERLLQPLGMTRTYFRPLRYVPAEHIAPTEIDAESGQPWHGIVHDEATRAWESVGAGCAAGGACGNAGLFSVAADLARFARMWLDEGCFEGRQIVAAADVRRALNETVSGADHDYGLGWNIDAAYMSKMAPPRSAGHAGFTGPTLFINPRTRDTVIILNNRVYPTRHGPNRMAYHRRIAEWLFQMQDSESGVQR